MAADDDRLNDAPRAAHDIQTAALDDDAQAGPVSPGEPVADEEASSDEIRAEAENYAEARRREADAGAVRIVHDAEQQTAAITARYHALLADITASENRLLELATSLRAVAASLEAVVARGAGHAGAEPAERADSLKESRRPNLSD